MRIRHISSLLGIALVLAACGDAEWKTIIGSDGYTSAAPENVRIYYRSVGSGDDVVVAPFATLLGTSLDSLAKGRRVVTYDPRGRGRSDSVPPDRVSLDLLLQDLDLVLRTVNRERRTGSVTLIGWSGGGMETFVYAMRNRGKVDRLVQLAPVAPQLDPYGAMMMDDRQRRTDSAALAGLRARRTAGVYADRPEAYCRAEDSVTAPPLFANPAQRPPTPDVCAYPNEYPANLSVYFGALFQSIQGFNYTDSLSRVSIPRLVIHGEKDNTPLEGNEKWILGQPNARLLVIPNAGHWPHYEQPALTLRAIEAFLQGQWPEGSVEKPKP
ncbi:MAG: alpha/beta hydrolase [Gemmatimonadales bacterium]|nr:alpha/beta hydrolase [Gemmatimonadales bacterium]